jgi:hypothetical protein
MDGFLSRTTITEEIDHHIGAVSGEMQSNGSANTATRTGYQDNLVFKW